MRKIYLDHNATTPLHYEVYSEMVPFLEKQFGNPGSIHWAGREARKAVEDARDRVAQSLASAPEEIVFTSGGTEANNLAIFGVTDNSPDSKKHIITSAVEHSSVLNPIKLLESRGFEVTYLGVDRYGMLKSEDVKKSLREDTLLISIMHANNETGNIFPVEEIGQIARERGVVFHCDAVQSFGKLDVIPSRDNIDLLSISGHKIYGPKGCGCLYVRKGVGILPVMFGGMQEKGLRPGTENVAGIAGFGKACEIAIESRRELSVRCGKLEDELLSGIFKSIQNVCLNGHPSRRISGVLNISFEGVESESVLMNLDLAGIAVSAGSACSSGAVAPSHVLIAMGLPQDLAESAVRFSIGMNNTSEEIKYVLDILGDVIPRLRRISPSYREAAAIKRG